MVTFSRIFKNHLVSLNYEKIKFWNENYNKAQQTAEPEINPNDLPRDLIKRILKFIY